MKQAQYEILDGKGGEATLRLTGDWTTTVLGRLPSALARDLDGRTLVGLDVSELGRFDTAGALALVQASCRLPKNAWDARPEAGRIYSKIEALERKSVAPPKQPDPITRSFGKIGRGVYDIGSETLLSFAFLGRLMAAIVETFKSPKNLRLPALVSQIERAGLDAIPIVVITNFFIGAVVAFIGADLLTDFGAQVFAVQLIGVAMFREFAVVIASVLLAGRSASSFAAEIGSMRMNQEVDAMQVMGVNPFLALVVPRLTSLVVMLPLLTFVGMLGGLLGGVVVCWSVLNIGPSFFFQRLVEDGMMAQHMMVGLIKAPVFALVIAAIGCRQGMSVSGDVESLGRRVTAAVVQAIFAIIFLDAIFALVFLELNI